MKWQGWAISLLLIGGAERVWHAQTEGFSISKMTHVAPPASPSSPTASVEIQGPLTWVGSGKQFYVFETADHQHVVKFMKWSRRRVPSWVESLPPSIKQWMTPWIDERLRRAETLTQSGQLALSNLQRETAVVIPQPCSSFLLRDKQGRSYHVNSRSTLFFVQRKATLFTSYFSAHLDKAPALLASFVETVATACEQGIYNTDCVVERNYGVTENRVIVLDIGSFHKKDSFPQVRSQIQKELFLELLPLRQWLQDHHPSTVPLFDRLLKERLMKCAPTLSIDSSF